MTPAVVVRNKPLATPQLHNQVVTVPMIAQFAHPFTCHSHVELFGREKYPINRRRNTSVRNGMEPTRVTSRMMGERAKRKGLAMRSCVVTISIEEVVWMSRGRSRSRRAVSSDRASGMMENSWRLFAN
jgi:hypothetical protein